jgi:DNA-binding winged helix-turn-helix (wHTH) protein
MDPPFLHPLRLGAVAVDLRDGRIRGANAPDRLTAFEIELLRYFVERAGQSVSREELIRDVWRSAVSERAVDQAVRRLRRRLEPGHRHSTLLLSVRGVGYRFVLPRETRIRAPISPLESLDPWLRAGFAGCCAFPRGFDAAAARQVAQLPEAALRALVRHGLLATGSSVGGDRRSYIVVDEARIEASADAVALHAGSTTRAANVSASSAVRSA